MEEFDAQLERLGPYRYDLQWARKQLRFADELEAQGNHERSFDEMNRAYEALRRHLVEAGAVSVDPRTWEVAAFFEPDREIPFPHAFIQWKGTQACMDVRCACGASLHADKDFLYALGCPHCHRVYETPMHLPLREAAPSEIHRDEETGGRRLGLYHHVEELEPDEDAPPPLAEPISEQSSQEG